MSHDQNFKNLIVDYPHESVQFFAADEAADVDREVRIIPVREEQLKERLGHRFRELDVPLLLEWPDGRRAAILFVFEEESETHRFSNAGLTDQYKKSCIFVNTAVSAVLEVIAWPDDSPPSM